MKRARALSIICIRGNNMNSENDTPNEKSDAIFADLDFTFELVVPSEEDIENSIVENFGAQSFFSTRSKTEWESAHTKAIITEKGLRLEISVPGKGDGIRGYKVVSLIPLAGIQLGLSSLQTRQAESSLRELHRRKKALD
jgi:hypothetical protein